MNLSKLIIRSFFHYLRANLTAAGGLAVAIAVITGALIIGDSLSHSLEKAVNMRLGNITHTITAGDRLFTMELGERFSKKTENPVSRALIAEGMAVAEGGQERLNKVQVTGVDEFFSSVLGAGSYYDSIGPGEVIISKNMADRLNLVPGDFFQLRMKRAGVIPANTPLVSDADQTVSRRVMVAAIAEEENYGRFNLLSSQTAPYNVFTDIRWLNQVMGISEMANIIIVSGNEDDSRMLSGHLSAAWSLEDANLLLDFLPDQGRMEISSERVFIENNISDPLGRLFPGSIRFLSYFVNSIEKDDKSTPYSFIAADSRKDLKPGETIINRWLADDLSASVGDSILIRYWETGPRRELTEKEARMVITGIEEMSESAGDSILIPHLPGLSDADNCRDWDAGVPVEFSRIRGKDEDYWTDYKGTPKAYISADWGQRLWSNRFGDLTAVWLPKDIEDQEEVREIVRSAVNPLGLGFQVNEVREQGINSAAAGVDFGMLFGGLGFFVMLAGVMLFFLLLLYNIEKRRDQIRLFSSLGYPLKLIRKIYLGEGMVVAVAGSIGGLLLAILYGRAVYWALTRVWQDIVRTDMLEMVIRPSSLFYGFIAGIFIALLVTVFSLNRHILKKSPGKGIHESQKNNGRKIRYRVITAIILALSGTIILLRQIISGTGIDPISFFAAGGLLLPAFLIAADIFLLMLEEKKYNRVSMETLSMKNLARNRTRSLSVIILLALGIFVVIATGSNRKDAATGETHPEGGTGGFLFVAEATVPVLHNLNSNETKLNLNIPEDISFIQMSASYADDASCLNLNQVANPRILSVDPSMLEGRFSFSGKTQWLDVSNPWQSLNMEIPATKTAGNDEKNSTVIPAIADQAVIQWGLGKKPGDTLIYTDEKGNELMLLLVGGLANSVFQGNIIISEKHFLRHFPTVSGSSFFLVDADFEQQQEIREELDFIFRDHGWEMTTAVDRLNEFNSVENTYLAIFLMLGALGILLGVVGLSVVMARSIIERKSEIALYTSLGYKRKQITSLIVREYTFLLIAGLLAGVPPALIASLPSLLPGTQTAGFSFLAIITAAILLNGMVWIIITSRLMIGNTNIIAALRND
jgi:putative ABC transport system permease protein